MKRLKTLKWLPKGGDRQILKPAEVLFLVYCKSSSELQKKWRGIKPPILLLKPNIPTAIFIMRVCTRGSRYEEVEGDTAWLLGQSPGLLYEYHHRLTVQQLGKVHVCGIH